MLEHRYIRLTLLALRYAIGIIAIGLTGCAETRVGNMSAYDAFGDERVARMLNAGDRGNLGAMDAAIRDGANVNAIGKDGISPLMWLLTNRRLKAAEKLLEAGADPNYKEPKDHFSAMAVAAGGAYPEMLELLLKHGGDPNARGFKLDDHLLIIAVKQFRDANIDLLLKYGADVNAHREISKDTAANVAVGLGRFDYAAKFLDHGLSFNLLNLAKDVEFTAVRRDTDAMQWKNKVIEMLKERGIQFPVWKPQQ